MAKKDYPPKNYAELLEWGLSAYMSTELYVDSENQCAHIFLNGESVGLSARGMRVRIAMDGLLIFSAELLCQYEEKDAIKVFNALNELNARSGITLYIDNKQEVVSYLCARQELYMDHLTLAAAKRTATRVLLAIYDWRNALMMLADRLPEYFSPKALEIALREGQKKLQEWQNTENPSQTMTEEEMIKYMASLVEPTEWNDDEELPF